MNRIQGLRQRIAHDGWAVERMLDAVDASGKPAGEALALLGHVVLSGRSWRRRLQGDERSGESLWPAWSLKECRNEAHTAGDAWRRYLEALTESDLDAVWEGSAREGLSFAPRVGDVLEHVLAHGAHHRGQIARALREAGAVPVNTDYLNYLREEAVLKA